MRDPREKDTNSLARYTLENRRPATYAEMCEYADWLKAELTRLKSDEGGWCVYDDSTRVGGPYKHAETAAIVRTHLEESLDDDDFDDDYDRYPDYRIVQESPDAD